MNGDDSVELVAHETSASEERVYRSRRYSQHHGALCSSCLAQPPRPTQRTCRPCHADAERQRRARQRDMKHAGGDHADDGPAPQEGGGVNFPAGHMGKPTGDQKRISAKFLKTKSGQNEPHT